MLIPPHFSTPSAASLAVVALAAAAALVAAVAVSKSLATLESPSLGLWLARILRFYMEHRPVNRNLQDPMDGYELWSVPNSKYWEEFQSFPPMIVQQPPGIPRIL